MQQGTGLVLSSISISGDAKQSPHVLLSKDSIEETMVGAERNLFVHQLRINSQRSSERLKDSASKLIWQRCSGEKPGSDAPS